jgi:hypothetical protein
VVKKGDAGDIGLLDNNALLLTREFNKMVDKIVELTLGELRSSVSDDKNRMQAD